MNSLLFFLYTLYSGLQQGILVWLFAEFVPSKYQEWIDAALHKGGVLLYGTLISFVLWRDEFHGWLSTLLLAAMIRVLVFDPALNLSRWWFNHRERRDKQFTPFAIGDSSLTDSLVLRFAGWLNITPNHLRVIIWAVSCLFSVWLYWFMST